MLEIDESNRPDFLNLFQMMPTWKEINKYYILLAKTEGGNTSHLSKNSLRMTKGEFDESQIAGNTQVNVNNQYQGHANHNADTFVFSKNKNLAQGNINQNKSIKDQTQVFNDSSLNRLNETNPNHSKQEGFNNPHWNQQNKYAQQQDYGINNNTYNDDVKFMQKPYNNPRAKEAELDDIDQYIINQSRMDMINRKNINPYGNNETTMNNTVGMDTNVVNHFAANMVNPSQNPGNQQRNTNGNSNFMEDPLDMYDTFGNYNQNNDFSNNNQPNNVYTKSANRDPNKKLHLQNNPTQNFDRTSSYGFADNLGNETGQRKGPYDMLMQNEANQGGMYNQRQGPNQIGQAYALQTGQEKQSQIFQNPSYSNPGQNREPNIKNRIDELIFESDKSHGNYRDPSQNDYHQKNQNPPMNYGNNEQQRFDTQIPEPLKKPSQTNPAMMPNGYAMNPDLPGRNIHSAMNKFAPLVNKVDTKGPPIQPPVQKANINTYGDAHFNNHSGENIGGASKVRFAPLTTMAPVNQARIEEHNPYNVGSNARLGPADKTQYNLEKTYF